MLCIVRRWNSGVFYFYTYTGGSGAPCDREDGSRQDQSAGISSAGSVGGHVHGPTGVDGAVRLGDHHRRSTRTVVVVRSDGHPRRGRVSGGGRGTLGSGRRSAGTRVHADDVIPIKAPGDLAVAPGIAPRLRLPLGAETSPALRRFVADHRGPASRRYQYLDLDANRLARHGDEAPIGAFVIVDRRDGARTVLVPLSESEMLGRVILRNFARDVPATEILERLHALVADAPCFRLIYSDVDRAATLLRDVFRHWPERRRGGATDAARPVAVPPPAADVGAATGRLTRTPGVREKAVGEALFLVDPDDQSIHRLSAVGATLWRLLAQPCRFEDAVDVLHYAFPNIERARIHEDVQALVAGLEKRGLISTGSE